MAPGTARGVGTSISWILADNGYRALALSLRGHGNSATDKKLGRFSIADYVDDVRTVAETPPTPPVVIGHSMGGLVVQKYLENQPAAAGVLLAAVPPQGTRAAVVRALKQIRGRTSVPGSPGARWRPSTLLPEPVNPCSRPRLRKRWWWGTESDFSRRVDGRSLWT